eukprot:GFUD01030408.1.p1 GENE.GFUD01030408.1~~GFUD01030408.1.p1  ORF type:complete len:558 (-),score=144.94 GFUD01030408.1:620-2293(-)
MDVVSVVQSYLLRLLEESGPGMKVMLLDSQTTPIVSLAFAQSTLMRQEVYLFERLSASPPWEDLRHLKCVCVVRPDASTLAHICAELAKPRYGSYYIYFTNILPKTAVKQLAEADMQEVVREVKEVYLDFLPIGSHLFGLSLPLPLQPLGSRWVEDSLTRTSQAITALLLSLKLCPAIRYQEGSGPASLLANSVKSIMAREGGLFSPGQVDTTPVLLVLDRREDPVTPLLTQWTYQAMVHQMIGINNNRVNLAGAPGVTKDLQDVVLSSSQDEFYAANLYSNFGEIGQTIKVLMEEFQNKAKSHQKIDSIADMKNFVENYPQFKKMSGTVSKHVTLVSELSRLVSQRNLLEMSELEQEIVSGGDHKDMLKQVTEMIQRDTTSLDDATRLCMLFALRFEHSNSSSVRNIISLLRKKGGEKEARMVQNLQRYAGQNVRKGDLFADQNNTTKNITGKLFKGLKGVENVYTQHSPLIKQILEDCVKNRLKPASFPLLGPHDGRVKTVVVFIIGGFTYEEAFTVHQLNTTLGVQIILGGTSTLNSRSFFDQIEHSFPPSNQE